MNCCCQLDFIIKETDTVLDFIINDNDNVLDFVMAECIRIIEGDHYKGPYEVIPLAWQEQSLETKNKVMDKNVTVFEIPYDETTNAYGTTVVIAS